MQARATQDTPQRRALDWFNFFLADVRDGLGPYLAVYLFTEQKWDEGRIGVGIRTGANLVPDNPVGTIGFADYLAEIT